MTYRPWFCIVDEIEPPLSGVPTIAQIRAAVSSHFGVLDTELTGSRGDRRVCKARSAAFFLSRSMTRKSFREIGDYFGGRDHTTVHRGVERATQLLGKDLQLAGKIKQIRMELAQ